MLSNQFVYLATITMKAFKILKGIKNRHDERMH